MGRGGAARPDALQEMCDIILQSEKDGFAVLFLLQRSSSPRPVDPNRDEIGDEKHDHGGGQQE